MPTYRTPDVYVEELSVFPPSVAEVGTAIPAFIGYTQLAKRRVDDDLRLKPTKIYSIKEYESMFGFPKADAIGVTLESDGQGGFKASGFAAPEVRYLLYYAIKMFFDNGGAQCYVVSVGSYRSAAPFHDWDPTDTRTAGIADALEAVGLEDEPTLIVIPEVVFLGNSYSSAVTAVLDQCARLKDRFGIFDVKDGMSELTTAAGGTLEINRSSFVSSNLKYGAAYFPFVKTTINYYVDDGETNVTVTGVPTATPPAPAARDISAPAAGAPAAGAPAPAAVDTPASAAGAPVSLTGGTSASALGAPAPAAIGTAAGAPAPAAVGTPASAVGVTASPVPSAGAPASPAVGTPTSAAGVTASSAPSAGAPASAAAGAPTGGPAARADSAPVRLIDLKWSNTAAYNAAKAELTKHFVVMPPSAAVAGVYAATDAARGVWKAPANVGLADVIEPVVKLNSLKQEDLNIDTTGGKSINAIRVFAGKGTLVWGARTLAGNDNEWRYISVRRFFNMVEESIKKSTYWAVFEPNDANTWVKVRGMIENYLIDKWRDGALVGATAKDAFFVKCGLGTTMTAQDILEGRMNVEIGMAVVRPAEFIVLKFSHKLQTS